MPKMELEKHIISSDGTRIGYRQTGSGEGLVIVHGTGRISQNYRNLAQALSENFTVYTPDRRGRGLSGKWTNDHSIEKEVDDLLGLIKATNAQYIFGHSFGGVIALNAAMQGNIKRLAVYEPPISIDNSIPADWLADFEKAILENKKVKAMAMFLKALPPPNISKFPMAALMLLGHVVRFLERDKEEQAKMFHLLYTIPPDMKIVKQLESTIGRYRSVITETLLMHGTNSQLFFRKATTVLAEVLPNSRIKTFEGYNHYSPEEKTVEIASVLKDFFLE